MSRGNLGRFAFNRGRVSKLALGRVDLDRTLLMAEIQTNWVPRTLGSMMLRPGFQYIGTIRNSSTGRLLPFVFSATDAGLLELTSTAMRVWISDALVTRTASTSAILQSNFSATELDKWVDADETGSTSGWASTGIYSTSTGFLTLVGTRYARAKRRQTVTSSAGTFGLSVKIDNGLVNLRVGSSTGFNDDYLTEKALKQGHYSFSITATGNYNIELSANTEYPSYVKSVAVESSGAMVLDTTWAGSALGSLRWDQSADVLFVANSTYQQKRIERHAAQSWAVVNYAPEDGPFRSINVTNTRISATAKTGNVTLAADRPLFTSNHIGALFRLTSVGQEVSVTPTGINQFSDAIRVSGVAEARSYRVLITASTGFNATITIQRSIGEEGSWVGVSTITSTYDSTLTDALDNQIVFLRIGVASTYTSGSPVCTLTHAAGGLAGVARITSFVGATSVTADVLDPLGSTADTELWEEGDWSNYRGWPSAVALHEGRLWWAGKGKIWGSISDAFESFDPDEEGDAGPINRTIASGGVDKIPWIASLGRLIVGTETREIQVKTGTLDEPLTPTNFNIRDVSNQGSAGVQAVKIDKGALFIQRGGTRVMQTALNAAELDYETGDRTAVVPEMGEPSIARMAVQRQPDTRVHCVRGATDGTVALLVAEPVEDVQAWIDIASTAASGAIEDVCVLPGTVEDSVYYMVRREINGSTVRYIEKWAQESQARGGSSNRMADSFLVQNSTATTTVSGLDHLVGSSVIAWGATADLGSYTVSTTGTITLTQSATTVVVGLPYEAWYKSAKLGLLQDQETALLQRKRVDHVGLLMADIHAQGLEYGPSTNSTDLDSLPLMERGTSISTDVVNATYDQPSHEFNGIWDTDSRIVLKATAPRPATILGAIITIEGREKK